MRVIELLVRPHEGRTVSELSRLLKQDASQVHRVLGGLVATGYAAQSSSSARYVATPKVLELAAAFLRESGMIESSRTLMRELRDVTGESVHLADATGPLPVCVAREISPHPVSVLTPVGSTWPLEGTAMGRAVAAFRLDAVKSIAERRRVAQVRSRGYAVDRSEYVHGVCGVAAPIMDWQGNVVGAIAISGPADRFGSSRISGLGTLVKKAGADISANLGYRAPYGAPRRPRRAVRPSR
jgi:DNA-binding IclR family transcriptional regulator